MAIQFLITAKVEYNKKIHYFGLRSESTNLGFLFLKWDIGDSLNCPEDDIKFKSISIKCEIDDNLPF